MSDQVKLISQWYVRPETEVDQIKRQYNLGFSDLSFLLIPYPKLLYLFKKPHLFNPSSFLEKLKHSLSQALVHFYPLAGQLVIHTYKDDDSRSIYVDCHKGPGVRLTQAEAIDLRIDDVVSPNSDIPQIVRSLFDSNVMELINYDGHTKPLLSVQVTELADGVVIGICINHCIVDATTSVHFYKTWSEIFMSSSSYSPSINNMPIVDGNGSIIKFPYIDIDEFKSRTHVQDLRERIFHFSSTSIGLLKAKANAEIASENIIISSFQALSAFLWRCVTRARNLCSSETTSCVLVSNLRPRYDPPLPEEYFGNYLMPTMGITEAGELLAINLGSAASLLHRAVVSLNEKVFQDIRGESGQQPQLVLSSRQTQGSNTVIMLGSPRLDVYGPEFGLGKAVAVHSGFRNKDGIVYAFHGAKDDSGVDLHVCLTSQVMSLLLSDHEFMSFASNSYFPKL